MTRTLAIVVALSVGLWAGCKKDSGGKAAESKPAAKAEKEAPAKADKPAEKKPSEAKPAETKPGKGKVTAKRAAAKKKKPRARWKATPGKVPAGAPRLVIKHVKPSDADLNDLHEGLKEAKIFEDLAEAVTEGLKLPRPILVSLKSCGEPNAVYDPEEHTIELCYELMALFSEQFEGQNLDEETHIEAVLGATIFVFLHELGHALVHELELPITGKEEDVVDQLATKLLVGMGDFGEEAALDAAESFIILSEETEEFLTDLDMADEHSLDSQRFFNIVCWVYGSDAEKHESLVDDEQYLPEERAGFCEEEWATMSKAWDKLLAPHRRTL